MSARVAPRDYSYAELCRSDLEASQTHAKLEHHMATCRDCIADPHGFCREALQIIGREIQPVKWN